VLSNRDVDDALAGTMSALSHLCVLHSLLEGGTSAPTASDSDSLAALGSLLFVRGIMAQHTGEVRQAHTAFRDAGPLLEAAMSFGGPRRRELDELARRCLATYLVLAGDVARATIVAEEACQRHGGAGLWRLLGEIWNQRGIRLGLEPTSRCQRDAAFQQAKNAYEKAERLSSGTKRSYTAWAFAHTMLEDVEGSHEIAKRAIGACYGFWRHPLQRPNHMVPGLASRAWHEASQFPWVAILESRWLDIRSEMEALQLSDADGEGWPEVRGHDRTLAGDTGVWREFPLLGVSADAEALARCRCPVTTRLLSGVDAIRAHCDLRVGEETALFSRMTPGTRLRPHCGPTNTHLTCHLGLHIPDRCYIRVGGETRQWEEGKCIVFDDSWEHEVWHDGSSVRVVLLVRFWHPDIDSAHRELLLREEARERQSKAWILE